MDDAINNICPYCGKEISPLDLKTNRERKFCNRQCWTDYYKRKREAEEVKKQKALRYMDRPKTPEEKCKRCRWGCSIGGIWGCIYFDVEEHHARLVLHPEGLPDECQEFERKKRGRKPKSITII